MTFSEEEPEEKNKQVARQFYDAFNRHDPEGMSQLVSSNASYTFHFAGMPATDWKGRKEFVTTVVKAFPDINHHILNVVAEGDKVALHFNITGTHKGQFQDIPATGKKISVGCVNFLTIIDGKIVEEWSNSDMMGLMQQIGAISVSSPTVNTG
ncbi:MAG: ester cyclase [Thermoproteota archaeon]|jgi:steroid delta-isomerase-like uncharacterized protein|nr:ester cyclase [Thermoproteota archaeon]